MKNKNLYGQVEKDIKRLEDSLFTMDDLRDVVNILVELKEAYNLEIPEILHYETSPGISYPIVENHPDGIKAKKHYEETLQRVVGIIYSKLRENLNFSDATIAKLTELAMHIKEDGENINNIYVIDKEFALLTSIGKKNIRGVISAPIGQYHKIEKNRFSEYVISKESNKLLNDIYDYVKTIPDFDQEFDMSDLKEAIYFDRPLNEIANNIGFTKVFIYTWDKLYSLIVKNNYGELEIIDNNEAIINLEEELNKTKQK